MVSTDAHAASLDDLPQKIDELTAQWLTRALSEGFPGVDVRSLDVAKVRQGAGTKVWVTVEYNDVGVRCGLPSSLVIKGRFNAMGPRWTSCSMMKAAPTETSLRVRGSMRRTATTWAHKADRLFSCWKIWRDPAAFWKAAGALRLFAGRVLHVCAREVVCSTVGLQPTGSSSTCNPCSLLLFGISIDRRRVDRLCHSESRPIRGVSNGP